MTGRTHDLAAFTALSAVVVIQPLPEITMGTAIAALGANMLGGIAPDIDQPTAPLWRNLPPLRVFGRLFGKVVGGHRFLSHSILGLAFFGFLFNLFLKFLQPSIPNINLEVVWWAFMIGFVSHLIMDTFTKEGVPWLLPVPISFGFPPIRALRVTTGEFFEKYILFPLLLVITGYIYYAYYDKILELLRHYLK
jgi:inner membrane protein